MTEFEPFEIEHGGLEEQRKNGYCPLLRVECLGERCMWWVRDWSEAKARFQSNCAVSLIAIGVNDEALQLPGAQDERMRRG
jgi:hypothetical protein